MNLSHTFRLLASAAALVFVFAVLGAALCTTASADELTPAVSASDIDMANCAVFLDGKSAGSPPAGAIESALGVGSAAAPWKVGPEVGKIYDFRIAFKNPVAIGTILTTYGAGLDDDGEAPRRGDSVAYLKAGAAYPGDVADESAWITLSAGALKTMPVGLSVRALRFRSHPAEFGYAEGGDTIRAQFPATRLYAQRYYSALAVGGEKTSLNRDTAKHPEWWMGYWPDPEPIAALIVMPQNIRRGEVDTLKPSTTVHPIIAERTDWKPEGKSSAASPFAIFKLDYPATTRAVRFTSDNPSLNSFGTLIPMVNLGSTPDAPGTHIPPPPFKIHYDMPMDGFSAVDIFDKASGKLVRRLVAEVYRSKGPATESWDMRDDNGTLVPPGDYTFTAVTRPPLTLTYQLTPYTAGQPAWWAPAPAKGGGGWMGDHSPPESATSIGDLEFFACPVQESGTGVQAVDHAGNKVWGEPYVTGFEIANRLAADDRYVYAVNSQVIQRIDTQNGFAARDIYHFAYTRDLPAGVWSPTQGGLAVKDGKIYVAFNGPPVSWLQTGFLADDLDPDRSYPRVWLRKGDGHRARQFDKIYRDDSYDELESYYAAFLTNMMPDQTPSVPDNFIPSSTQAYFGDSASDGPFAGQLVAAFHQPVTVGSILLPDASTQVWVLKPGATLPSEDATGLAADPDAALGDTGSPSAEAINEDDWIPLPKTGRAGAPGLVVAPAGGLKTQAIRFKANRLPFVQVMVRRFDDATPEATTVYEPLPGPPLKGEGADAWTIDWSPDTPINRYHPARMAYVWPAAVKLRGVCLIDPNAGVIAVDQYIGTGDPKSALADDSQWKELGRIVSQTFNGYYGQVATERNIDFGSEIDVRALRLRAMAPPGSKDDEVGGPWPASGTPVLGALVACRYLGEDPQGLSPDMSNRITVLAAPGADGDATVIKQIPFASPGALHFALDGDLYAVSGSDIVSVPLGGGESKTIIGGGKLDQPSDMAFDSGGLLYVSDVAPEQQVVKVFDPKTGELVRTIGKPGGAKPGPWDPNCIDTPSGITIDSAGKLWIASYQYNPKRISRWDAKTGTFEASFFGPTQYGGGGHLDSGDRSVLIYNGMKFRIDWTNMTWKLEAILERQGISVDMAHPDRAIYVNGKRFLGGNGAGGPTGSPASICYESDDIAHPIAVFGNLADWKEIGRRADLLKAFGNLDRRKYAFVWTDKNGDGIPEASEVQIAEVNTQSGAASVGDDLTFNFDGGRLRPSGFDANGYPEYDISKIEKLPLMSSNSRSLADGKTFVMTEQWDRLLAPDGKTVLWQYFDRWAVHDGFYRSGYGYDRPPGVLNAEQFVFGAFKGPGDEQYFVTSSDQGDWFVFTHDGFLVGCIFGGPKGYGLRRWTMPDWTPGQVDLSDVRLLQECYQGDVVRANDGVVYAVAGKNYPGIVKVEGLEQLARVHGDFAVTQADVDAGLAWSVRKSAIEMSHGEAKVARVPYVSSPMSTDGSVDEWPDDLFFNIDEVFEPGLHESKWVDNGDGALAYDAANLYIAAIVPDASPLENSATDLKTLFKNGDAVDVQLGLDPNADPNRTAPAPGDVRILLARVKGQPVVELYRYKVPGTSPEQRTHFSSPVGDTYIDDVHQITDAQLGWQFTPDGYTLTAAIPWSDLGVAAPKVGTMIRGDMGILQSDQNGVQTVNRLYWSGKSQTVTVDLPSESRLSPPLWGEFYTSEPEDNMKFGPDADTGPDMNPGGGDLAPSPDAP